MENTIAEARAGRGGRCAAAVAVGAGKPGRHFQAVDGSADATAMGAFPHAERASAETAAAGMQLTADGAAALADLFALASAAFASPAPELAEALETGEFWQSWDAAWAALAGDGDAAGGSAAGCVTAGSVARAGDPCLSQGKTSNAGEYSHASDGAFSQAEGDGGLASLRREYSRLYDLQGPGVLVWPYESCFLYRERGGEGMPGLFRTPQLIEVEAAMRAAGAEPADRRTEPADSAYKELAFLSLLFARAEKALSAGDSAQAARALAQAREFFTGHAAAWLPVFMRQTADRTQSPAYRCAALRCLSLFDFLAGAHG